MSFEFIRKYVDEVDEVPRPKEVVSPTHLVTSNPREIVDMGIEDKASGVTWVMMLDYKYDKSSTTEPTKYQVDTFRSLLRIATKLSDSVFVLIVITYNSESRYVDPYDLNTGFLSALVLTTHDEKLIASQQDETFTRSLYLMTNRGNLELNLRLNALGTQRTNLYNTLTQTLGVQERMTAVSKVMSILPVRETTGFKYTAEMKKPLLQVGSEGSTHHNYFNTSAHTSYNGICPICQLGREACIGHEAFGLQVDGSNMPMPEFTPVIASHSGNNPHSSTIIRHPHDIGGSRVTTLQVLLYSLCWTKMKAGAQLIGQNQYRYPLILHPVPATPNPYSGINSTIQCTACAANCKKVSYYQSHTMGGIVYPNVIVIKHTNPKKTLTYKITAAEWAVMMQDLTRAQRLQIERAGLNFMFHAVTNWVYVLPSSFMMGDEVNDTNTLKSAYQDILGRFGYSITGLQGAKNLSRKGGGKRMKANLAHLLAAIIEGKEGAVKSTAALLSKNNLRATTVPCYPLSFEEETYVIPSNRMVNVIGNPNTYSEYLRLGKVAAVELTDGTMIYASTELVSPLSKTIPESVETTWIANPNTDDTTIVHSIRMTSEPRQTRLFKPTKVYRPLEIDPSLVRRFWRQAVDGDYCMSLRDPVIRAGSICAYKVKFVDPEVLGSDSVIGVGPSYFASIANGDNDGDQIPVIFFSSQDAQKLLRDFTPRHHLSLKNGTLIGWKIGHNEIYTVSKYHNMYFRMWKASSSPKEVPDQQFDVERFRVTRKDGVWSLPDGTPVPNFNVEMTFASTTEDYTDPELRDIIAEQFEQTDSYILGAHMLMCLLPRVPRYEYGEKSTSIKKGVIGTYSPTNYPSNSTYTVAYDDVIWCLTPNQTVFTTSDIKESKSSIIAHAMRSGLDPITATNYFAELVTRFQTSNVDVGSIRLEDYYSSEDYVGTSAEVDALYSGFQTKDTFTYNENYAPIGLTVETHRQHVLYNKFMELHAELMKVAGVSKLDVTYAYDSVTSRVYPKSMFTEKGYLSNMVRMISKLDSNGIRSGLGAKGSITVTTANIDLPRLDCIVMPYTTIASLACYGFSVRPVWSSLEADATMSAITETVRAQMGHALRTDSIGRISKSMAATLASASMSENGRVMMSDALM